MPEPFSATAPLKSVKGTVSKPGVTFTGDEDTGFYSPNSNELSVAVGGAEKAKFTSRGLGISGDVNLDDGVAGFITTLQTVTPTANRTISLPNATGTVGLVAGASSTVTYNLAGAQAGDANFTWDATTGLRLGRAFGYGSGGGTVTQATNKSTGVTLNTLCGRITMNGAQLDAATAVSFTLTNSQIAATDLIVINHVSGGTTGSYMFGARAAAGSATITVRNVTAGNLSEAVVLAFAVIKATTT